MTGPPLESKCCGAEVQRDGTLDKPILGDLRGGLTGTRYYTCSMCGRPCSVRPVDGER